MEILASNYQKALSECARCGNRSGRHSSGCATTDAHGRCGFRAPADHQATTCMAALEVAAQQGQDKGTWRRQGRRQGDLLHQRRRRRRCDHACGPVGLRIGCRSEQVKRRRRFPCWTSICSSGRRLALSRSGQPRRDCRTWSMRRSAWMPPCWTPSWVSMHLDFRVVAAPREVLPLDDRHSTNLSRACLKVIRERVRLQLCRYAAGLDGLERRLSRLAAVGC